MDEDSVYACTGNPRPAEMRELLTTLFRRPFDEGCAGKWVAVAGGVVVPPGTACSLLPDPQPSPPSLPRATR